LSEGNNNTAIPGDTTDRRIFSFERRAAII